MPDLISLKRIARRACAASGVNAAARYLTRRVPRILLYHGFKPDGDDNRWATSIASFRRQLNYIKNNFVPLTMSEIAGSQDSRGCYPARAVAVTIDDGYENFLSLALPILEELRIPATVYVVSDLVDQQNWIWTDKVIYLLEDCEAGFDAFGGRTTEQVLAHLKTLPVGQRDDEIQQAAERSDVHIPQSPPTRYRLMSWDQIRQAQGTGLVEIGSHTCTHPILTRVSDDQAWREIDQSKTSIERRTGREVASFCFPNGQPEDYAPNHLKMLRQAGYTNGVAAHFGYVTRHSDSFALPRLNFDGDDLTVFAKYLDGVEYLQRKRTYNLPAARRETEHRSDR